MVQPRPGIQPASFTPTYVILDRKKCPGHCWYYYAPDGMGNDVPVPIPTDNVIVGYVTNVTIKETPENQYLEDSLQVSVKAERNYVLRTGGRSRQQGTVPSSYKGLLRALNQGTIEQLNELVAIETTPTDQAESVIFVNVYADLVCDSNGNIISGTKLDYDYHNEEAMVPDPRAYIETINSKLNQSGYSRSSLNGLGSADPLGSAAPQPVRTPVAATAPKQVATATPGVPVKPITQTQSLPQQSPQPQVAIQQAPTKDQVDTANIIKESAKAIGWYKEGFVSYLTNSYRVDANNLSSLSVEQLTKIYGEIQDPAILARFCPPQQQLAIPKTAAAAALEDSEIPF